MKQFRFKPTKSTTRATPN